MSQRVHEISGGPGSAEERIERLNQLEPVDQSERDEIEAEPAPLEDIPFR